MPNWVRNRVVALNPQELKKHIIDESGAVDFNMVIPMPEDLEITSGSYSYAVQNSIYFSEYTKQNMEKQVKVDKLLAVHYDSNKTQQEFLDECLEDNKILAEIRKIKSLKLRGENKTSASNVAEAYDTFIKGYFNVQRYGSKDWYDWRIKNWGTKWNASDSSFNEETGVIEFDTAWSMPENIFRALSHFTPLRVVYADEDLGSNCGMEDYFVDEDGNEHLEVVMEGSVELANDTWGYSHISVYDSEVDDWIEDEENPKFIYANKDYHQTQEEINRLMSPSTIQKDFVEV